MLQNPIKFVGWTLLCGCLTHAQSGLSPQEVSPELVRQMRRQAALGVSSAEAEEHRKLREADAELLRRIQAGERKRADLERYVGSLDISVDTRLLVEAKDDIKELKRAAKAAEEESKREREASRKMIETIQTGVLMLVIGALFKWVLGIWQSKKEKQVRTTRHGNVMAALDAAKNEARAAYTEANNVNGKIESLGIQIRDGAAEE